MEFGSLEAFHTAHVELLERTSRAKRHVGEMDIPNIRKKIMVSCIDLDYWDEVQLLRAYFEVYEDEQ